MDAVTYATFVLGCFVLVVVPGPTVTVIIANSLRSGTIAGLMNVAGTQAGLAVMLVLLAFGLDSVMALIGEWFDVLRWAGAAYLIYLGIKMWRSDGRLGEPDKAARAGSPARWFRQGVLVIWSNPKALLFFGAFIPQFVDPAGDLFGQTVLLGLTFMVVATIFDSLYAIGAGRAGAMLARKRIRLLERVAGSFLISGGLWLALTRRA